MANRVNAERIEEDFMRIVAAAVAGERCPQSAPFGPISSASVSALFGAGRIRSEVYSLNWRVITILTGEHAGLRTAPPPHGGQPYLVNGVHVDRIARRQDRQEAGSEPRERQGSKQ